MTPEAYALVVVWVIIYLISVALYWRWWAK